MKNTLPRYAYSSVALRLRSTDNISNPPTENRLPLIVSLTSIKPRLDRLDLVIRSLLVQKNTPEKIVLWLNKQLESKVPKRLSELQGNCFSIRFTSADSPHCKLAPSIEAYPDTTIVTVDDDQIYDPGLLSGLYQDHQKYPERIVTIRGRRIAYKNGIAEKYPLWNIVRKPGLCSPALLQLGFRGVLYPADSLHKDARNWELIEKLSPKADDLWFKAMAHLKGTEVMTCTTPVTKAIEIKQRGRQKLADYNVLEDGNSLQWQAICAHYGIMGADFSDAGNEKGRPGE